MAPFTARWRQTVAAYDTHNQATAAVGILVRKGFPAEELSIVAEDLSHRRELGYPQAALGGAAFGAVLAAMATFGLAPAAAAGALLGAVARRLSVRPVEAGRYVVVCDGETADEAAALLRSAWRS
jgi:hypothetical protein